MSYLNKDEKKRSGSLGNLKKQRRNKQKLQRKVQLLHEKLQQMLHTAHLPARLTQTLSLRGRLTSFTITCYIMGGFQ